MKICLLAYAFYKTDNRVRRYAEALVRRGDTVDVISIARSDTPKYEVINGVNVYCIQKRIVNEKNKWDYLIRILCFFIKSSIALSLRHLRSPYHVVHVHSVPDFEVFAAIIPKLCGSKLILDIHDLVPEFYAAKFGVKKNDFVFKLLVTIERICCRFVHHTIISNDVWRNVLISRSVKPENCTTILNYPDPAIFKRYGKIKKKNDDTFSIIYPGTLNYHQGVDIAIQAMSHVTKTITSIEFSIYGTGPMREKLINQIKHEKLDSYISVHDMVPLEEIAEKMAKADLGVVPKRSNSFGNEAFSTKTLEFMALGVPVIASETKIDRFYFDESIIEFFKPEDVKDLSEKIIYLYNNEQRRNAIKKNALAFAAKNCWSIKSQIYLNVLKRIMPRGAVEKSITLPDVCINKNLNR